jgi:anion transporter
MDQAVLTLCVLGVMAILFVTEAIPLAITSMAGAIALGMLGVIPMKDVFSGLSNTTVVLFAGMFVVGASLFYTGLAQKIGNLVVQKAGKSELSLMLALMVVGAIMSAISSNTGTCAALMPVVMGICSAAKIPAARQLMPLAFACGFGGIMTLIGTPPNIIVSGALDSAGYAPFGFFEFAWIGVPIAIASTAYMMFIGKHLLPKTDAKAGEEDSEANEETVVHNPAKMWVSGAILIIVVIFMALNIKALPLHVVAVIGALITVLTKCMTEKQAYRSIDWVTIFLFAGMMPVAKGMEVSGAGKLIADTVLGIMGDSPSPYVITAILFILSCGLTQFMSNTASCALLAPIGISIAEGIGADPHAVLMAIGVAASCAFATPIGTPPNTLVLGPGGYKFTDYIKAGGGLIVVCFVVSIIVIPMVWPFFK